MADKNVSIDITAADRTAAAFASVKRGLGELDGKAAVLKNTFSAFGALAATTGITALFTEAIAAASKAEQSSNRLNAVIKATGDTAGFTREELDKMAESLSKATTFDDEGIRDAQAILMKFGRLHGDTFERALKLSADYAAFTGGTMVEATQLIGKALADPINGVTALGKAIGKLSQTEQEAIQTAMEHGHVAEAQAVIFAKLERTIGGTAGEMNSGIYGATTAATKAWDDMLKAIGRSGAVTLTVENSLITVANLINGIRESLEKLNQETNRSVFFNGQLKLLPPDVRDKMLPPGLAGLQGSKLTVDAVKSIPVGAQSLMPPDKQQMTVDEARALGASERAKMEEAAQARAEAAAALEKRAAEERKKADESFWRMANLKLDANDQWNKSLEETRKKTRELEDEQFAASLAVLEENQQEINAAAQFMDHTMQQRDAMDADKAKRAHDSLVHLMDELQTARALEDQDWIEKNALLKERFNEDYQHRMFWYTRIWQLDVEHQQRLTAIEDAAIKKRYGNANVYRRMDMDSALFFANSLAGLMQTKSRTLFEIGKAGAIAGAIIDSYKAATGAYASLASIPFVGPALGAAAAAAAIAIGFARVQAIRSTTFGSSSGAVGTFAANPSTGLPETPSPAFEPVSPVATQAAVPQRRDINITIVGEQMFSSQQIRDSLIPALNEALGDGVRLNVNTR